MVYQLIYLILVVLGWFYKINNTDFKKSKGISEFIGAAIAALVTYALLYFGGFFNDLIAALA